jgi:hypothetical protein
MTNSVAHHFDLRQGSPRDPATKGRSPGGRANTASGYPYPRPAPPQQQTPPQPPNTAAKAPPTFSNPRPTRHPKSATSPGASPSKIRCLLAHSPPSTAAHRRFRYNSRPAYLLKGLGLSLSGAYFPQLQPGYRHCRASDGVDIFQNKTGSADCDLRNSNTAPISSCDPLLCARNFYRSAYPG